MKHFLALIVLFSSLASFALDKIGEGVRQKKVVLFTVDVYDAKFFASDKKQWKESKDNALDKVMAQAEVKLEMKFLRTVEHEKIEDSFKDSLETNDIKIEGVIKDFFKHLEKIKEIKENQSLIIESSAPNKVKITLPEMDAQEFTADGVRKSLFSIWFGKPADDKLKDLKAKLSDE